MSKTINISSGKTKNDSKEGVWLALGEKYGADELEVYERGDMFDCGIGITEFASYGYELTWKTKEDHIHVAGDGKNEKNGTHIIVDEPTHFKPSIAKLEQAIKCQKEIEANRKKYYHIRR